MSEPATVPTPATFTTPNPARDAVIMSGVVTPPSTSATSALVNEVPGLVALIKQLIAAEKAGGIGGLVQQAPAVIAEGETLVKEVQAAIPEIKAGYKTTEFWLTVGVIGVATGYALATGKPMPTTTTALLAAVTSIYAVIRTLAKGNAAAAANP